MTQDKFEQLLHKKARISVEQSRHKVLSAANGKRLILMLDDINLIDEKSSIGRFLKSYLS
jgi:hypothetical protein